MVDIKNNDTWEAPNFDRELEELWSLDIPVPWKTRFKILWTGTIRYTVFKPPVGGWRISFPTRREVKNHEQEKNQSRN